MRIILILGCALSKKCDGSFEPGEILITRLKKGLDYYNKLKNCKNNFILVTGGSSNKKVSEGIIMAKWLVDNGVDRSNILVESASKNTIENFIYSRIVVSIKCQEISEKIHQIVLVTSDFHMVRSRYIMNTLFPEVDVKELPATTPPMLITRRYASEFKINYMKQVEQLKKNLDLNAFYECYKI